MISPRYKVTNLVSAVSLKRKLALHKLVQLKRCATRAAFWIFWSLVLPETVLHTPQDLNYTHFVRLRCCEDQEHYNGREKLIYHDTRLIIDL